MKPDHALDNGSARTGRGRPSKLQAEVIDRQVLDAARACFTAAGFDGTTMEAIAARARVTKVTLYLRYPDKVALLRAVMHERVATWSEISDRRVSEKGDTLDLRLRYYGRSILRWSQDEEVKAFGKLIRGCWGNAQAVADEMAAIGTGRMRDVLAADIRVFGAAEGLNPSNPHMIADLFLGMLTAFSAPPGYGDAALAPLINAFADRIVDVLLQGRSAW